MSLKQRGHPRDERSPRRMKAQVLVQLQVLVPVVVGEWLVEVRLRWERDGVVA